MKVENYFNINNIFIKKEISDIYACCINIPEVVNILFPDVDIDNIREKKNIRIDKNHILNDLLHYDEIIKFNEFKLFKRQIEWFSGRITAKKLISLNIKSGNEYNKIIILNDKNGAPYLKDHPHLSVSISHSYDYAVAALCINKNKNLGIDIEKKKKIKNINSFMKIAFTTDEINNFSGDTYRDIYKQWTQKEAYLKYLKLGFREGLKNVEIIDDKIYHNKEFQSNLKVLTEFIGNEYIVSIVFDE